VTFAHSQLARKTRPGSEREHCVRAAPTPNRRRHSSVGAWHGAVLRSGPSSDERFGRPDGSLATSGPHGMPTLDPRETEGADNASDYEAGWDHALGSPSGTSPAIKKQLALLGRLRVPTWEARQNRCWTMSLRGKYPLGPANQAMSIPDNLENYRLGWEFPIIPSVQAGGAGIMPTVRGYQTGYGLWTLKTTPQSEATLKWGTTLATTLIREWKSKGPQ